MKANIDKMKETAKNFGKVRDMELIRAYNLTHKGADGRADTFIDARLYMARSQSASVVYCLLWINPHHGKKWARGYGKAGGYGYDKKSAAMGAAIESAGIVLSERIDGVGEDAMRAALTAIGAAIGAPSDCFLVESFA